jgi:hypothetical protein
MTVETMDTALPLADQFEETNYQRTPYGPSSASICRVINGNSCGSGTIVGFRDGKTLVLTNAHVAGTTIGRTVTCQFPNLANRRVNAKVIMAAYSDRVMMDWAVLEIAEVLALPATKLSKKVPTGEHYTGGYPRCEGPFYQKLVTRQFTHNGTVWRWQPISIGGQSGSGVHSFADHLYYGLLTWSWGGDGAGQTTRSIWLQYSQRAAIGFLRPEGLIELADNRAEGLESGFFQEASISDLPIWHDESTPPPPPPSNDVAKAIKAVAEELAKVVERLKQIADGAGPGGTGGDSGGGSGSGSDDGGPTFGL